MLTRFARQRGFTLVELMVAITVLAILFFLALPDFRTWIQNTRIRSVAEALQNGVRQAQAEAVRRNRTVVFFLTNAEPSETAAAVADGVNWAARTVPVLPNEPVDFVRGGAFSDVAPGVTITGPAAICFNAVGQQVTIAAQGCAAASTDYDVNGPVGMTDLRRLRINVSLGGRARMCDRDKILSDTHPDGCSP
ncbi:Tfp pilus assembly protein FimT/FimU [Piscinibacter sp.]|uniref:Tfp pilus assembly protein FimT/FimU n=1 Tax=Piscinibacter sp. TaxID=1903157 RepID=UPI0039E4B6A3